LIKTLNYGKINFRGVSNDRFAKRPF